MTPEQLEAENGRLVSRERLDLAPTDVLGLFVVGRLARRHGIDVRLMATPGTGVTAEVLIPDRYVVRSDRPAPAAAPAPAVAPVAPVAPAGPAPDGRGWWESPTPAVARAVAPGRPAVPAPGPSAPAGFASVPARRTSPGDRPDKRQLVPVATGRRGRAAAEAAAAERPGTAVRTCRRSSGWPRRAVRPDDPADPRRAARTPAYGTTAGGVPAVGDDARQDVEDFEAGVRRALRRPAPTAGRVRGRGGRRAVDGPRR
jgi:hypothetical protein